MSPESQISKNKPSERDPLAGHPWHLAQEQEKALASFKDSLAKAELYRPAEGEKRASHEDAVLLRFLRARRFDVAKAQKQFAETEDWRKENDIENLYADFDPEEFEVAKRFYPRWTGRRDKIGIPVYVYKLSSLSGPTLKELQSVPADRRYQRIVALWEFMTRFTTPLCSYLPHPAPEVPIVAVTTIIDFADCSIGTLWSLRGHLQQASTIATARYPESMHSTVVVNAPGFFNTVWGWIKNWFDEGTRNKIYVLGADCGPTLRELIEPQNLPKLYGGELEFEFADEPNMDEEAKKAIDGDSVPRGPVLFDPYIGQVSRPMRSSEMNGHVEPKGTA